MPAPGPGLKPDSGAIRESADVTEVEVDAAGDGLGHGDGDGHWDRDGTDDRVDVDGLQYDDDYMLVKKKKMLVLVLLLMVVVMSAGPCGDARVYLHFHVRVNRDDNVWTEMR